MILETFRQALQNVWSNKLRTFLTMLGIIIGVAAVITLIIIKPLQVAAEHTILKKA